MTKPNIKEKIEELIDEAYNAYSEDSIEGSIKLLNQAWELLPEDFEQISVAYDLVKEFVITYYYSGHIVEAEGWIERFLKCDKYSADYGEAPHMAAKIKFDLGKFDEAKPLFALGDKKSGGRMFKGEDDPKYFMFYKKK